MTDKVMRYSSEEMREISVLLDSGICSPTDVCRALNQAASDLEQRERDQDALAKHVARVVELQERIAELEQVGQETQALLVELSKYAPVDGALCAPTAMMGFGWRAKRILAAQPKPEQAVGGWEVIRC